MKSQPEEHSGEFIPQHFAGTRTIQPNTLDPYMCKIPAAKLRELIYMKYFEAWLFASDTEIGAYHYLGMA